MVGEAWLTEIAFGKLKNKDTCVWLLSLRSFTSMLIFAKAFQVKGCGRRSLLYEEAAHQRVHLREEEEISRYDF